MKISICATSRFHYQQLAYQLVRHHALDLWVTAMPLSKLPKDLHSRVASRPSSLIAWIGAARLLPSCPLRSYIQAYSNVLFDYECLLALAIKQSTAIIGLSHHILAAGNLISRRSGLFICDVPIAHPSFLNRAILEESHRWGVEFQPLPQFTIGRESSSFLAADHIVCPSSFVKRTLLDHGIPDKKVSIIPYGSSPVGSTFKSSQSILNAPALNDMFVVLFVGNLSLRKGIPYLIEGFRKFSHPRKRLLLVGTVDRELLRSSVFQGDFSGITVVGPCNKEALDQYYRLASVFVLPSLAEGLALVITEAMSYSLPIIYTYETGASDILVDRVSGMQISCRSAQNVADALTNIADDTELAQRLSRSAYEASQKLQGWNSYGNNWMNLLNHLKR